MIIAITGGSGFIGRKLVNRHLELGDSVRMLTRNPTRHTVDVQGDLNLIYGDLIDNSCDLSGLVKDVDVLYHCAGEVKNPALMPALHVDGTNRLITAASGAISHWVQLSSVGAYGPSVGRSNVKRIVTEETATKPVGIYETTKTKADELVISAAEEGAFSYSILRPSNVYGAGMPNDSLRQWARIIREKLFFYVGPPGAVSTYVHVDDVVDALMLCGCDSRAKGEIFNISNDCSQECLVEAIAKVFNVSTPRLRVPESVVRLICILFSGIKNFPLSRSRIDALVSRTHYPTDKLEVVFGYRPKRNIRESIDEVFLNDIAFTNIKK